MNTIEQRKARQQEESQARFQINGNILPFLQATWGAQVQDFHSEQACKAGPGRKHKQGACVYIPAATEKNSLWTHHHQRRLERQHG